MTPLREIAEAERAKRAAGYVARLQDPDPARRWSRARVEADRKIWQSLVDWLTDRASAHGIDREPDWIGFVAATTRVARTAMKAHVHDPASREKSDRAASLWRLARMIAIAAWARGHDGALEAYDKAMDLSKQERAAA